MEFLNQFAVRRLYFVWTCCAGNPQNRIKIRSSHYFLFKHARVSEVKGRRIKLAEPRQVRLTSLWALDDRATFLTSIPCAPALRRCQLLEFVAPVTAGLETFRAKPVSQFFAGDSQMAVTAPDCRLAFGQQFERTVMARSHVKYPTNKLTNQARERQ
jgi:hypothetical protein